MSRHGQLNKNFGYCLVLFSKRVLNNCKLTEFFYLFTKFNMNKHKTFYRLQLLFVSFLKAHNLRLNPFIGFNNDVGFAICLLGFLKILYDICVSQNEKSLMFCNQDLQPKLMEPKIVQFNCNWLKQQIRDVIVVLEKESYYELLRAFRR